MPQNYCECGNAIADYVAWCEWCELEFTVSYVYEYVTPDTFDRELVEGLA